MTAHDPFSSTIHKTNSWLKALMEELAWEDKHKAYQGLSTTLHALRDRLTVEEAVQLGAQLPMLIRGFYYEGWSPTGKPVKARHKEEFLAPVTHHFKNDPGVNVEQVVRAVFTVLASHITAGELEDVKLMLPKEVRDLWPDTRLTV